MSNGRLLVTGLAVASVTLLAGCAAPVDSGYSRSTGYHGSSYSSYDPPRYYRYRSYGYVDPYVLAYTPRYVVAPRYVVVDDDDEWRAYYYDDDYDERRVYYYYDDDDDDDDEWRHNFGR